MPTFSRSLVWVLALAAAACSDGGAGGGGTGTDPVARVEVTAPSQALTVGSTLQLSAVARSAAGSVIAGRTARWSSSNEQVARISETGLVTAAAPGPVRISASVDGQSGFTDLTITAAVAAVMVVPDTLTLSPGATRQLTATARDAGGTPIANVAIRWESANDAVARVNSEGVVQAVAGGTVQISAVAGTVRGSATVRVSTPPPSALRFTQVWTGALHACAVSTDERAYCWGSNASGSLGQETGETCPGRAGEPTACSTTPRPVAGDLRFKMLALGTRNGNGHTCGITTAGKAYCWGTGAYGELGTGTADDIRRTPAAVVGDRAYTAIVAGDAHTCGLVSDGTVFCWGENTRGQVGSGTTFGDPVPSPAQVSTPARFVSIAAGGNASCGLTAEGKAYCWGNFDGGTNSNVRAPVATQAQSTFRSLSVGGNTFGGHYVCGVTTGGDAVCWGRTSSLAGLGNGTMSSETAVAVTGGGASAAVSAGNDANCILATDGAVRCWGINAYGEAGDGTTTLRERPVPVQGPAFRSVSARWYTCGIGTDGFAYCWGRGDFGALGAAAPDRCQANPNDVAVPCSTRPVRVRGQD
ncbi:MAG: hypothetical protein AVDCRST_MAG89-3882 [uncultured Gemmatimonadetes bacterium]|uniref:BIG2 domain-containing protein n=1 Tax=uncultured Gemmatimonadota bacterium TaxID=203437 RepID=A0A6J4MLM8_9BACT|nr:MAG: hypothetical protein AVDCRST_MAG89-3882 [uncultured Gemmatimonadota bacterium]